MRCTVANLDRSKRDLIERGPALIVIDILQPRVLNRVRAARARTRRWEGGR